MWTSINAVSLRISYNIIFWSLVSLGVRFGEVRVSLQVLTFGFQLYVRSFTTIRHERLSFYLSSHPNAKSSERYELTLETPYINAK